MLPNCTIFLIGPMGVGKSTVGRALAEQTSREFLDSDHEIERRTGASIPWIFELEGESGFRRREAQVLADLALRPELIVATGGGAILLQENRAVLATGRVVYLRAALETLFERTRRDRQRPLLQTPDPRATLQALLAAREPLYAALADLTVLTDGRPAGLVAREILQHLETKAHAHTDG